MLDRPVLALHAVLHANGFGHLIHVNGKEVGSSVSGTRLLDIWDGLCFSLRARCVSVQDKSMKYGLLLRLIHALAYGHNWYGRWDYKFERGSYGNTEEDYRTALMMIRDTAVAGLLRPDTAQPGVLTMLQKYHHPGEVETVSDLYRLTLDLLKSTKKGINKSVVAALLKDFTTDYLFGESSGIEDAERLKKRAKRDTEIRRAAQVLLDCRWFCKDYRQVRRKALF